MLCADVFRFRDAAPLDYRFASLLEFNQELWGQCSNEVGFGRTEIQSVSCALLLASAVAMFRAIVERAVLTVLAALRGRTTLRNPPSWQ